MTVPTNAAIRNAGTLSLCNSSSEKSFSLVAPNDCHFARLRFGLVCVRRCYRADRDWVSWRCELAWSACRASAVVVLVLYLGQHVGVEHVTGGVPGVVLVWLRCRRTWSPCAICWRQQQRATLLFVFDVLRTSKVCSQRERRRPTMKHRNAWWERWRGPQLVGVEQCLLEALFALAQSTCDAAPHHDHFKYEQNVDDDSEFCNAE